MTVLKRYSKPHEAGDQASGGRDKLLKSTANLSRTELLIRETLQNSWDAREEGWRPAYGVRIRRVSSEVRRTLRQRVFSSRYDNLPSLRRSLEEDNTYVLEIYDRGTVGLNGPVRANEAAAPGEPNNFNPLVFDIGTTKDADDSGGTYGFGKTAAFEASSANTLIYWSATENQYGEIEYRLIASALGDPYTVGNRRYTGAHWWGDPEKNEIMPLIGHAAQELGESLFDVHFGSDGEDHEKGTSILILDPTVDNPETGRRTPVRTDKEAELLAKTICESLALHAWPKVIPDSSGETPMIIDVYHNDVNLGVTEDTQIRYSRYGTALAHVRRLQGEPYSSGSAILKPYTGQLDLRDYPITLNRVSMETPATKAEFWGSRNDRVAGHLVLMKTVHVLDDDRTKGAPMNQLALMRSRAELLVAYDDMRSPDAADFSWHGVFKPTPEVDRHFARTEPSTHDAWTPNIAGSDISKSIVDRTLKQIQRRVSEFLDVDGKPERDGGLSVKKFANSLSGFAPAGVIEQVPSGRRGTSQTGVRRRPAKRELVTIDGYREIVRSDSLEADQEITFSVSPRADDPVEVSIAVKAQTPEGSIKVEDTEFEVQWFSGDRLLSIDKTVSVEPGFSGRVVLSLSFAAQASVSLTGKQGR